MVIYQNALFRAISIRSFSLNSSSVCTPAAASSRSSLRSIKVNRIKTSNPIPSRIIDRITGALISPVNLTRGIGVNMARAVPIRPVEVFNPIAKAISFPRNQRTTALLAAIPNISHPTPKTANPKPATTDDLADSEITCQEKILNSYIPCTCPEIAQYLTNAPISIMAIPKTPVNRTPSLSRIIPLKISISRKTLNHPYPLVKNP
jgi:hypothetical protein